MSKHKQHIIPSVTTPKEWRGWTSLQLRKYVAGYVKAHYKNTTVINDHTQLHINITVRSGQKTAYGEAMYSKKAALITVLPDLIKYAVYNNFGPAKTTDSKDVLGYLNFKVKCKIDGKIENIRLAVQFQKGGKFYYNIEVNKIKKACI